MSRWIVVADSASAEIFEQQDGGMRLVETLSHPPSRDHNRELIGNRPNLNQHPMEKGLKGDEAQSLREDESLRFAKDAAEFLRLAHTQNRFRDLVLVADPRTLGRLRLELAPAVEKCVTATIAKRALQLNSDEIAELVRAEQ